MLQANFLNTSLLRLDFKAKEQELLVTSFIYCLGYGGGGTCVEAREQDMGIGSLLLFGSRFSGLVTVT